MKVNGYLYGYALSLTRLRRELPPGGSLLINFAPIRTVEDACAYKWFMTVVGIY